MASIGQIQSFLKAETKNINLNEDLCVLAGPYFMKWSEKNSSGLIYTGPGPIGNGVVVEGLKAPDFEAGKLSPELYKILNSVKTPQLSQEKLKEFLSL